MKQYKAYIFDLYGTLVDIRTNEDEPRLWQQLARFYSYNGANYFADEIRGMYKEFCSEEERILLEKLSDKSRDKLAIDINAKDIEIDITQVFRKLYLAKGVTPTDELIASTAQLFRTCSTKFIKLYAGTKEMLQALRANGCQVYLLSNAQAAFTLGELKALGIYECFDEIYISSEVGFKKPSAIFFNRLLSEQSLLASDCLMIGNDLSCDIAGAMAVGMDSFYIHTAISPKESPTKIIPTYSMARMNMRELKLRLGV